MVRQDRMLRADVRAAGVESSKVPWYDDDTKERIARDMESTNEEEVVSEKKVK